MWNEFGEKIKDGNNLDVLKKGQRWFASNKELKIIGYGFVSKPSKPRLSKTLSPSSLKCCEICGMELYKYQGDIRESALNETQVIQKKHLIFNDISGGKHFTCHGLNRCFDRVSWNHELSNMSPIESGDISVEDILPVDLKNATEEELERLALFHEMFDRDILPVIVYWRNTPITRNNVIKFMEEWSYLTTTKLSHWFEDRALNVAEKRLLTAMGVKYES